MGAFKRFSLLRFMGAFHGFLAIKAELNDYSNWGGGDKFYTY